MLYSYANIQEILRGHSSTEVTWGLHHLQCTHASQSDAVRKHVNDGDST